MGGNNANVTPREYVYGLIKQANEAAPEDVQVDIGMNAAMKWLSDSQIQAIAKSKMSAVDLVTAWQRGDFGTVSKNGIEAQNIPAWIKLVDLPKLAKMSAASNAAGSTGMGQPAFLESLVPFWGSGRAAIDYFQHGQYVWGTVNAGLAVSDIFLVKSLVMEGREGLPI